MQNIRCRFGLHLALERSSSTYACMRLHVSSFPESQKHWAYFMASLDAMWHHFLLEKESEVHGKHGEYAQRLYSVFHDLSSQQIHASDAAMEEIERFVVLMYVCTSKLTKVNDSRQIMFPMDQCLLLTSHPLLMPFANATRPTWHVHLCVHAMVTAMMTSKIVTALWGHVPTN